MQHAEFPLVIVGSGPTESALKKQAQDLRLKNIHFLGLLPDTHKTALLQLCYSVVFPSHLRAESFGITLLEGAMYGKPLISTDIGTGTTYVNIAYETGIVVPPSNPKALREAMDTLWKNPEQAQRYGKNAARRFQDLFTSKNMVESYIEIYKKLMKNSL